MSLINALVVWGFSPKGIPPRCPNAKTMSDEDLYRYMEFAGMTYDRGEEKFTDDLARERMYSIMELDTTSDIKFNLLHALDVDIQNNGARGMASSVIKEICEMQYQLIKAS